MDIAKTNSEPLADLAQCMDCDWKGLVTETSIGEDGDWESGYYLVHLCPRCGGGVEYDMSTERLTEWSEWDNRNSDVAER